MQNTNENVRRVAFDRESLGTRWRQRRAHSRMKMPNGIAAMYVCVYWLAKYCCFGALRARARLSRIRM